MIYARFIQTYSVKFYTSLGLFFCFFLDPRCLEPCFLDPFGLNPCCVFTFLFGFGSFDPLLPRHVHPHFLHFRTKSIELLGGSLQHLCSLCGVHAFIGLYITSVGPNDASVGS